MALFGRPSERDEQKAQAYAQWMQQRNPFAIASMVLGVFSLVEFGVLIVFGVGGIVCGVVALWQLSRVKRTSAPMAHPAETKTPPIDQELPVTYATSDLAVGPDVLQYEPRERTLVPTRGHRLAWGGIALSVISLIFAAILYLQRRGHA
jgi:hypothetical protein